MNGFWPLAWAQLCQLTVVILVVGLLVRLFGRRRPHLASALWLVVLLKCVTPPLVSSPSGVFCWLRTQPADSAANRETPPPVRLEESDWSGASDKTISFAELEAGRTNLDRLMATNEDLTAQIDRSETDTRAVSAARPSVEPTMERPDEAKPAVASTAGDTRWLLICWMVGSIAIATTATARWCHCWYVIRRAEKYRHESLEKMLRQLSRQLNLRRKVRLVVTRSQIGPAVIGILRPTVLLPSVVVEGKSAAELEPILAHELVHLRRGDLWVGLLQVFAQALWWFHPLVWLANRLSTRDAERCCDEEVIARLGCDPLRYARSLVDVLELKQTLKPVPVFPGVRPVEVTSKRLERIMKLGQGSLKRTPWWCWAAMLAATALTLPGAALVADGKEKGKSRKSATEFTPRAAEGGPLVSRTYRVDDIVAKTRSELGLSRNEALSQLAAEIKRVAGGIWAEPIGIDVDFNEVDGISITESLAPTSAQATLALRRKSLVIRQTAAAHARIRRHFELKRKLAHAEIEIEAVVITTDPKHFAALTSDWTPIDVPIPEDEKSGSDPASNFRPLDRPLPDEGARPTSRGQTVVEKNLPLRQAVINNNLATDMLHAFGAKRVSNVRQMPKITCFNGQSVTVQDAARRPFVVSLQRVDGKNSHAYQPRIRVVNEGITMRLRPVLQKSKQVWLDVELNLSEIRSVEEFKLSGGKDSPAIQIPEVATTTVTSALALPAGKTLVIGGLPVLGEKESPEAMLVMLRAVEAQKEDFGGEKSAVIQSNKLRRQLNSELNEAIGFNLPEAVSIREFDDCFVAEASPWRSISDVYGKILADDGRVTIRKTGDNRHSMELEGNARLQYDGTAVFADRVLIDDRTTDFSGHVSITEKRGDKKVTIHADRVLSKGDEILMRGTAELIRVDSSGKSTLFRADRIHWNTDSDQVTVDKAGTIESSRSDRFMFGVSTNSDAGVTGQVIVDQTEFQLAGDEPADNADRPTLHHLRRASVRPGEPIADSEPTDDEILVALDRQRPIEGGFPFLHEVNLNNARIVKEKIADYVDPPRHVPLVGSVRLHHAHYKCTVHYEEETKIGWPVPNVTTEDRVDVVYIEVTQYQAMKK